MNQVFRMVAMSLVAVALVGFSAQAATIDVLVKNNFFEPKDITITVEGVQDLVDNEGIHGDVLYDYVDPTARPKEFTIRVDLTDDLQEFVRVICHEMVHVKQWARGEMYSYDRYPNLTRWHKQKIDHDKMDYYEQPWEIEAHGREEGLTVGFLHEHQKWAGFVYGIIEDYKMQRPQQMVLNPRW